MSAATAQSAELSAVDARGVGIQIVFFWHEDRYGHRIYSLDGKLKRTLLESIEGGHDENWPASPPLQQASVSWITSDTEHAHVAMLVGGAGKNHWSMCVSAHDQRTHTRQKGTEMRPRLDETEIANDKEPELFFDVSCRAVGEPVFLGSTYRAYHRDVAVSKRLNCAFVPAREPGFTISPRNAEVEVEGMQQESPIVRCVPTEIRRNESPATVRWQYAIRRSSGGPVQIDLPGKLGHDSAHGDTV